MYFGNSKRRNQPQRWGIPLNNTSKLLTYAVPRSSCNLNASFMKLGKYCPDIFIKLNFSSIAVSGTTFTALKSMDRRIEENLD